MTSDINKLLGSKSEQTDNPTTIISELMPIGVPHYWDEPEDPEGSATPISDSQKKSRDFLRGLEWDPTTTITRPRAILSLNGHVFATPGNLGVLSSFSKGGKSSVGGAILASILPGTGDCLGFESSNPSGGAVINVDTEQSKWHHHQKMLTSLRRKRIAPNDCPDWLKSYTMSGFTIRLDQLKDILAMNQDRFGSIHSVMLDGGADFVKDPNDTGEAFGVVQELRNLASLYNTHILVIIHINPSSKDGKTRGHFGSELERKAETNLEIKITGEHRIVYAKNARDCFIPPSLGTPIKWCEDSGMFISCNLKDPNAGVGESDILGMLEDGSKLFSEILSQATELFGSTERTMRRRLENLVAEKKLDVSGIHKSRTLELTELGRSIIARVQ